jgi:HSP20 family protein
MNTLSKTESQAPSTGGTTRMNYMTPLANIVETNDGYVLEAEMPGVSRDGLEITVENGDLTILGRRKNYESPGVLLYGESRGGDFRRTFEIDPSIETAGISAKIDQGVLTLHLPKAEAVKPRKISVTD